MDKEMQLLTSMLDQAVEMEYEGVRLHHGNVGHHEVFISKCGIGKVNAAINTFRVIKAVNPDIVINSGVAGGAGVPVGTLLIADRAAYHDVWCGPGTEYGAADGFPLFLTPCDRVLQIAKQISDKENTMTGLVCSGDKFISKAEEIKEIRSHFPDVKAVDMESATIAQTCTELGIPFGIVRVVSDTPGEGENISQYQNFWTDAPLKTFSAVREIIGRL